MNAAEILDRAERSAIVRRLSLYVVAIAAVLLLAWAIHAHGVRQGRAEQALAASLARTEAAQVVRAAAIDTAAQAHAQTVHAEARAAHVDTIVRAYHDTVQLRTGDTLVIQTPDSALVLQVPPQLIARIVADSLGLLARDSVITTQRVELGAVHRIVAADSLVITTQAHTIDLLLAQHAPRCGWRCGAVIGAVIGATATLSAVYTLARIVRL